MANQKTIKEDVIFPRKDDDGELLPRIPTDISDVGDVFRRGYDNAAKELFSKLEKFADPEVDENKK